MNRKFYNNVLKAGSVLAISGMGWFGQQAAAQVPAACGNDINLMARENPEIYGQVAQFKAMIQEWLQTADLSQLETSEAGSRIIPVVVHVIHQGGSENISKSQIESQITAINKDFQALNSNLSGLDNFEAFDSLVANVDIEFRLATKDPNGNCTDGIVRIFSEKTNEAKDWTNFKRLSYWDRSKYFNIWIVRSIYNDTQFGSILGYAQFPFPFNGEFPLTSTDGVTVISSSFGTTGTASGGTGATLTHEAGHWLGLFHIWGDDSCGSDGVEDTPVHLEPNFSGPGCFPLPKLATCYSPTGMNGQDSIDAIWNRDSVGEMWMNFMDYTDDNCLWMFTKGQKQVMDGVFNTYSFRGNLITPANNIATGTDDASISTGCNPGPIADFWAHANSDILYKINMRCAGASVTFTEGTFNGTPNAWNWTFEGGTPGTSTVENPPAIVYNTPGVYDVTMTSSNSIGSSTKIREDYIHILPNVAEDNNVIYHDDFEWGSSLYEQGKWIHVNEGNLDNKWEQYTNGGYMSGKCVVMRNEGNVRFEQDALVTASYNLQSFQNDKMYFRFAYAKKTNNPFVEQTDVLEVYASTNCGQTWTRRNISVDGGTPATSLSGNSLVTAGLYPDGFIPTDPSHWKQATVDLGAAPNIQNAANVRLMFVFTSGGPYGNDLFIDQFNISNSLAIGIDEQELGQTAFEVFPNPVSTTSQIYFNLLENSDVKIDVLDMTGRVITSVYNGDLSSGDQYFQVANSQFNSAGIYMVRLTVNGVASIKKIIVD